MDNGTDSTTSTEPTTLYDPTIWGNRIWSLLFLITAVLGICGNVAITWIVWAHRSMKTITNVYIGNMGLGGLLITVFAFPFVFPYQEYLSLWEALPGFCVMFEFSTKLGVCVFVFSLMMMTVERYYTITAPDQDMPSIRYRPTFNIWFFSFIFALPHLLLPTLETFNFKFGSVRVCYYTLPKFLGGFTTLTIYFHLFILVTYFIPVGIMIYQSIQLGKILWGHKTIGNNVVDKKAHQQTVKMMIVQMIVFAILWLPYTIGIFISAKMIWSVSLEFSNQYVFIKAVHLIIIGSTVFYPIIYVCMEDRFQKKLKKVFRWCPCVDYESKSLNYVLGKAGNAEQPIDMVESYRTLSDV